MKSLEAKGAISICKEENSQMDVIVEGLKLLQIEKLLRERDIQYEKTCTDYTSMNYSTSHESKRMKSPLPRIKSSLSPKRAMMNWNDYHPLNVIYDFMESLEIQFPSTCTVMNIGKSVEGRDIKLLKISNSNAENTGVWLDGAIHSREWISTSVVTYIADHIAKNFNKLPSSITNKDWFFLPVVNPDGYHHTCAIDRMWRKNRARFNNTIVGVDLNRNFGHFWDKPTGLNQTTDSSSGDPSHLNYRGPAPFSEPETSALKDIILYSGTPFKIFLTFHSYSEVIAFPWCYTAEACPDYVNLLEGGTVMAKAIYETTGRMYKVGNFKDIMYYACGTSIDWSYGTARIPFSYLVELRGRQEKFLLPKEQIQDCCKENLSGVKALAEFVDTKKCLNCVVLKKNR